MYIKLLYRDKYAVRMETQSDAKNPEHAKAENILSARDALENIRRHPFEKTWQTEIYRAAKVLAAFYGNIQEGEIVASWMKHYGPGWCLEQGKKIGLE